VTALNDEHAVIAVPALVHAVHSATAYEMIPSPYRSTVNLHDTFYAVQGEQVIDIWPIAGRGYSEHRRAMLPANDCSSRTPDEWPRTCTGGASAHGTFERLSGDREHRQ
jgi:hypothetical protein